MYHITHLLHDILTAKMKHIIHVLKGLTLFMFNFGQPTTLKQQKNILINANIWMEIDCTLMTLIMFISWGLLVEILIHVTHTHK